MQDVSGYLEPIEQFLHRDLPSADHASTDANPPKYSEWLVFIYPIFIPRHIFDVLFVVDFLLNLRKSTCKR